MGEDTQGRKAEDTKKRILQEAEQLFADQGFDSTGIDQIAKNVGISKSVIYYHFKNKKDILSTLIDNYLGEAYQMKMLLGSEYFSNPDNNYKDVLLDAANQPGSSWRRISKILMMESIKNSQEMPVFDLWDANFKFVHELFGDKFKATDPHQQLQLKLKTFLMMGFPWLAYQVFGERIAEQYDVSSEELREIFIDAISEYFEQILKDEMWDL